MVIKLHPFRYYSMLIARVVAHSWSTLPDIAFSGLPQHWVMGEREFWVPLTRENILYFYKILESLSNFLLLIPYFTRIILKHRGSDSVSIWWGNIWSLKRDMKKYVQLHLNKFVLNSFIYAILSVWNDWNSFRRQSLKTYLLSPKAERT